MVKFNYMCYPSGSPDEYFFLLLFVEEDIRIYLMT